MTQDIIIVRDTIPLAEVRTLAEKTYTDMIKGAVDCARNIIAIGGEWHMDANTVLIADGSTQQDVWGFNIYFDKPADETLQYNSLINIRPKQGNTSMDVEDTNIQHAMRSIIAARIPELSL